MISLEAKGSNCILMWLVVRPFYLSADQITILSRLILVLLKPPAALFHRKPWNNVHWSPITNCILSFLKCLKNRGSESEVSTHTIYRLNTKTPQAKTQATSQATKTTGQTQNKIKTPKQKHTGKNHTQTNKQTHTQPTVASDLSMKKSRPLVLSVSVSVLFYLQLPTAKGNVTDYTESVTD